MRALLEASGGLIAELGAATLSSGYGLLSETPHSLRTVLVAGACIAAGGDWRTALWPSVGAECMMAGADLLDDAADADVTEGHGPAVLLTVGAGMLGLATVAVTRVIEDGAEPATATALAQLLGQDFARAVNGQAANLQTSDRQVDALTAYGQAAAKSGPLGALIARLGARTATSDPGVVQLLGEFGHRLGVRSQLLNDARDAAPDSSLQKADVRAGARTVPLAFTGSGGAPIGLTREQVAYWERAERERIAASGGLAAALALAEAERLAAERVLDRLAELGKPVDGLRQLL